MALRSTRSSTKRSADSQAPTPAQNNRPQKRTKMSTQKTPTNKPNNTEDPDDLPTPDEPLRLQEEVGDIFDAPPNTLIIHACNCQGSWNAGIARAFKDIYPHAYREHVDECAEHGNKLLRTAQLIPIIDAAPKHFVGCLFTSRKYGQQKDKPAQILAATKPAMEDLLKQVQEWNRTAPTRKVGEVRMCKINSGLFKVKWEKTKAVLESIDASGFDVKVVKVVERQQ